MTKTILLAYLLLFSAFSLADNFATNHSHREIFQVEDKTHILLTYKQSSKWNLQEIVLDESSMQETIFQKIFSSFEELSQYRVMNYPQTKSLKFFNTEVFPTTEIPTKFIWKVENDWSQKWEDEFHSWVEKNFHKNFFVDYQIKTDCADAAFALRWIFARIHKLPAANTLAGSHIIFSQDSFKKEWSSLSTHADWDKDELFLAALDYILENAYTKTLNIDTYPVELTKQTVRPGLTHLDGGHTMIISKVDYSGNSAPIWKLSSTVPSQVRQLFEEIMLDTGMTAQEDGGLVRMRWPIKDAHGNWSLTPKKDMDLYSEEQYDRNFQGDESSFTMALIKKLGIPFVPKNIVKLSFDSLIEYLNQRIEIVENGYQYCLTTDCSEGTQAYEDHSTPSRDKRLLEKYETLDQLSNDLGEFDPNLYEYFKNLLSQTDFEVLSKTFKLEDLIDNFKFKLPSYDPRDSIKERWAYDKVSIKSAFDKKAQRLFVKREKTIQSSLHCIQNQTCKFPSPEWYQFNTFEFDNKLLDGVYNTFLYLQDIYPVEFAFHPLQEKISKIPFYGSEPFYTEQRKKGEHKDSLNIAKIKVDNRTLQLHGDLFLIDTKIQDIKTNQVIAEDIQGAVLYNRITKVLFYTSNNTVMSIDTIKFQKQILYTSTYKDYQFDQFTWFDPNHIKISLCEQVWQTERNCQKLILILKGNNPRVQELGRKTSDFSFSFGSSYGFYEEKIQEAFTTQNAQGQFFINFIQNENFNQKEIFPQGQKLRGTTFKNDEFIWGEKIDDENHRYHYENLSSGLICSFDSKDGDLNLLGNSYFVQNFWMNNRTELNQINPDCSIKNIDSAPLNTMPFNIGKTYFVGFGTDKFYALYDNQLIQGNSPMGHKPFEFREDYIGFAKKDGNILKSLKRLDLKTQTLMDIHPYYVNYECNNENENFFSGICSLLGNYNLEVNFQNTTEGENSFFFNYSLPNNDFVSSSYFDFGTFRNEIRVNRSGRMIMRGGVGSDDNDNPTITSDDDGSDDGDISDETDLDNRFGSSYVLVHEGILLPINGNTYIHVKE